MKFIKKFLCMALITSLVALGIQSFPVEAKSSTGSVVVTPDTFGSDSSIYTVLIGYDVIEIQDGSFSNLVNLKEIKVDSKNPYYASCNGCLYNKDYTELLCIPQNTTSVQVKTTITSYSPHALDGLAQSRKNALDDFLANKNNNITQNNSVTAGSTYETENNSNNNYSVSSPNYSTPNDVEYNTTPNISTDFSQYVYEENGRVCFRYTGSGQSVIVVPEGVQKITGFTDNVFKFNNEITTVYLPSTLTSIRTMNMFNQECYGWENVLYDCLYQCPNLQIVQSSSPYYQVDNIGVWRPLADGSKVYTWSPSVKIPYDKSVYYSTGSIIK